ncbi:hypothetical protein [Aerococcus urinaeequi]|uniref:hypothetical protein n=1 Tax=Aerococcus urinaeequi TaxID=51665 RepID=UPI00210E6862|nr:hypothetical protein [Aerococcus urinaeequi]
MKNQQAFPIYWQLTKMAEKTESRRNSKMVRNKSIDLNNHLFEQLERLNDTDLKGDDLKEEIERSKAVAGISKNIIENSKLALEAEKLKADFTGDFSTDNLLLVDSNG